MLISFEGIDGSGKTTQIKLLRDHIISTGKTVQVFREPGGTAVSEKIRSLLLDPENDIDPVTEMLLFSSARSHLVKNAIKPALEKGIVVILDRFYDSTTAYQGFGRGVMKPKEILKINDMASHKIEPDVTFYLHLSYKEALHRRTTREKEDRMEQADQHFFERVIEGYQWLAATYSRRFKTIPAHHDVETTNRQIIQVLNQV
jgi:dTMP kinase